MPNLLAFAMIAIPSLLVIINPLLVTSVFITLTGDYPAEGRRRVAFKTSFTAFAVLLAFAISGSLLFKFFAITIGAFQIAGGVILLATALGMLHAQSPRMQHTPEELAEARNREDIAVVPLAIPITSGPGAITTVIVLASEARHAAEMAVLFVAILVSAVTVWLLLRNATRIARFLGPSGINIATRLMGLVLAAVAVQFVLHGIESSLPEILAHAHAAPPAAR